MKRLTVLYDGNIRYTLPSGYQVELPEYSSQTANLAETTDERVYIPHSENTTTRVDFDINEYTSSSILYGFDGLAQVLAVTQVETGQTGENHEYGVNRLGYLYDGRGSNAEFRYDPFGAVISDVGQEPIFGYNGESYNPATELQYLRYRYYSPTDGRFRNADSYLGEADTPLTLNRYAYTGNDPVNRIDPDGMFFKKIGNFFKENAGVIIGAVVGVVVAAVIVVTFPVSGPLTAIAVGAMAIGVVVAGAGIGGQIHTGIKQNSNEKKKTETVSKLSNTQSEIDKLRGKGQLTADEQTKLRQLEAEAGGFSEQYRKLCEDAQRLEKDQATYGVITALGGAAMTLGAGLYDAAAAADAAIALKMSGATSSYTYMSASDANTSLLSEGCTSPPYTPGTQTVIRSVISSEKWARVYDGINSHQNGRWIMKASEVSGLTAEQIQNKFALPYLPKYVSDATIPVNAVIREGRANGIFGFDGQGWQADIMGGTAVFSNERLIGK